MLAVAVVLSFVSVLPPASCTGKTKKIANKVTTTSASDDSDDDPNRSLRDALGKGKMGDADKALKSAIKKDGKTFLETHARPALESMATKVGETLDTLIEQVSEAGTSAGARPLYEPMHTYWYDVKKPEDVNNDLNKLREIGTSLALNHLKQEPRGRADEDTSFSGLSAFVTAAPPGPLRVSLAIGAGLPDLVRKLQDGPLRDALDSAVRSKSSSFLSRRMAPKHARQQRLVMA
ncbi:unnamed protein product [Amoebophrya sp. A120]|nr:unnamed protein product [Amoebophrya sp. A120]|eukprot:GSA120T00010037001.1